MRPAALLAVATALALPGTAAAKEVRLLTVCGADGCSRITEQASLRAFEDGGGPPTEAPRGPQAYYVVHVHMGGPDGERILGFTTLWLHRAGVMASQDEAGQMTFVPVSSTLERSLREAVRGLAPRPARPLGQPSTPAAAPRDAAVSERTGSGLPALAWAIIGAGALALAGAALVDTRRRHLHP